jgi:hypothetical protein
MSVTPCTGCKKRRNSSFYKDEICIPPKTFTTGVMPPSYTFPSRKVPPRASPMTTRSLEGYSHLLHKSSNSLSFVHRQHPSGWTNCLFRQCGWSHMFRSTHIVFTDKGDFPPVVYPLLTVTRSVTLRWTYKLPSVVRLRSLQRARTG